MLKEISSEIEKVVEKHQSTNTSINELITDLKDSLTEAEEALASIAENEDAIEKQNEASVIILDKAISKVVKMDINKSYNTVCNNFYGNLSKLGKIMMKDFDKENIDDYELYPYNKNLFYSIIAKDLYRRGDFNTADSFIKEANIPFDLNFRFIFKDLNIITRDLKNKSITSLAEWCERYEALLTNMKSMLQFECTKLSYVLMINDPQTTITECVAYSKKHFNQYLKAPSSYKHISKLMTLLLFKTNVDKCPYEEFKLGPMWDKVSTMFIKDCCTILNLPNESWFYLCIVAGMISLPQILKAETILKTKRDLVTEKELPYEIQLPNQLKFHNLFICPVTKEISIPENPPMLLSCGHCVCLNALEKIIKNNVNQIKCPTCPNLQYFKDAHKLYIF